MLEETAKSKVLRDARSARSAFMQQTVICTPFLTMRADSKSETRFVEKQAALLVLEETARSRVV
jgi:hypothetical protein